MRCGSILSIWLLGLLCLAVYSEGEKIQAVAAPVLESMVPGTVSVVDFGARADGKTDDTPALQKAVSSGALRVYLPPGDYSVGSEPLAIPRDVHLVGAGANSTIHLATGTTKLFLLNENVVLRDFQIRGTWAKPRKFDEDIVHLPRAARGATIERVTFTDCEGTCIGTSHAHDLVIRECSFEDVMRGISLVASDRVKVVNNTLRDATKHGFQFWGNAEWKEKVSEDLLFSGNIMKDAGEGAIWGCGAVRVVMANNIIDGASDVGLDLEWSEDSVITGNTVRNCKNAGISCFFASERVTITGNTVINDWKFENDPDGWWCRAGIWLTYPNRETFPRDRGHRNITIVGNTIHNVGDWRRPIWVGAEADNITIAWNTITGGDPDRTEHDAFQPVVLRNVEQNVTVFGLKPAD